MKPTRIIALLIVITLFTLGPATVFAQPTISSVQMEAETQTSATITWATNEPSSSVVYYGTDANLLGSSASSPDLVTDHSITLFGLSPKTLYFFSVSSTNANDETSTDDNGGDLYTFTTEAEDTAAPVITNVQITDVTAASATITWTTDEDSDSTVDYSTDANLLGSSASSPDLVTDHSITLSGLSPETPYFFSVSSSDTSGNTATDDNDTDLYTLTTGADETAPVISDVQVSDVTATGATITWTTNEDSSSVVNYGTDSGLGSSATHSELTTSHSATLAGLSPETEYLFRVVSTDASGNTAIDSNDGDLYNFTTIPDDDTALVIEDVEITDVTATSATVTWATDDPSDSAVDYGTDSSSLDSGAGSSDMVTDHSVVLSGLEPDTTYVLQVSSSDAAGNTATDDNDGDLYTFTTAISEEETERDARKAFPGVVVGDIDDTVTIRRNGTGELVTIRLPQDYSLRTPGGPRAGEFETGARVVILAEMIDDEWVARRVLVKPVRHQRPITGVVVSIEDGQITVAQSDGSEVSLEIEGSKITLTEGEVIIALGHHSGKARGLVQADQIRKRLQEFLSGEVEETEDDEDDEEDNEEAEDDDDDDERRNNRGRGHGRGHGHHHIEFLMGILENHNARTSRVVNEILGHASERDRDGILKAQQILNRSRKNLEEILARARSRLEDHLDKAEGHDRGRGHNGRGNGASGNNGSRGQSDDVNNIDDNSNGNQGNGNGKNKGKGRGNSDDGPPWGWFWGR